MNIKTPSAPVVFVDSAGSAPVVIFTAPSSYQRVGIAFAYEGYGTVYWFRQLLVYNDPGDLTEKERKKGLNLTKDSGILFHAQTVPDGIENLDYRMIINGLWTPDPLNPLSAAGSAGIRVSRVSIPKFEKKPSTTDAPPGSLRFSFRAAPGETVTVAGSFNNWDPFMYRLKETSPGVYALTLPLPPGVYQYVFFHRGERVLDPYNSVRVYTKSGAVASQAEVKATSATDRPGAAGRT